MDLLTTPYVSSEDDAAYVLNRSTQANGFYGASSIERLPAEQAIKQHAETFTAITF